MTSTAIRPNRHEQNLTAPLLKVHEVSKHFGRITALDGVSFTVGDGELFGLLGPNGAGKSTLLAILSGLLATDTGTVFLGDVAIESDGVEIRRQLGLAPQDIALYPELTAAENLRFFGRLYRINGSELEARIDEILSAMGLTNRRDSRVEGFSGGMKRRLNLAAAVLHRPRILFLDEPTAGVDPQSRNHIFQEVRRLNADGMTIVYTSHYMEEVQALCPRVGIIDAGRLLCCESVAELLNRESTRICFRGSDELVPRLRELAGVISASSNEGVIEVNTKSTSATLPLLLQGLASSGQTAEQLKIEPPTLERVFLQMTGHELRD